MKKLGCPYYWVILCVLPALHVRASPETSLSPAQVQLCEDIVEHGSPTESIAERVARARRSIRGYSIESKVDAAYLKVRTHLASGQTASDMRVRLAAGDPHLERLKRWGFVFLVDEALNTVTMQGPPDWRSFFAAFNQERVEAGVSDAQALAPALGFRRVGRPREWFFIRPGVDPWPDQSEWVFEANIAQIPHALWEAQMKQGLLPMDFTTEFFHHDMGHLTELVERPEAMVSIRQYYALASTMRARREARGDTRKDDYVENRVFFVFEFFQLPRLSEADRIRRFLGEENDVTLSLNERRARLAALSTPDLTQLVNRLCEEGEAFFARQGGGLRDPFNLSVRHNPRGFREHLRSELMGLPEHQWQGDALVRLSAISQWPVSQLWELRWLRAAAACHDPLVSPELSAAYLSFVPAEDRAGLCELPGASYPARLQARLRSAMEERIARIQASLAQGLATGLTFEQVVRDAGIGAPSANSATRAYIESFTRPGSALRNVLLQ